MSTTPSPKFEPKAPEVGQMVLCPADRGDPAQYGKITWVGEVVRFNTHGVKYVWVEVECPDHRSIWPSHRLGFKIKEAQ